MVRKGGVVCLRGGRIGQADGGEPKHADILISTDGRITALGSGLSTQAERIIDLDDRLVTPALVDMHQHLDKSFSIDAVLNPSGTLPDAIAAFRDYSATLTREVITERAQRTIELCLSKGTVAIRTHANVDYELGLRSVEALVELREQYRDRAHLDVVAFLSSSAARGDIEHGRSMLEDALALGANTVGGTPNLSPRPEAFIDMLLETAARHNRALDLHVDESLDPEARCLEYCAVRSKQMGMGNRLVAGHCSSLSAMDDATAARIMHTVRDSGIGIVTLPAANLYLLARESSRLPPRGLTRIAELLRLGVPVATASDNIQDAFLPVGSGDLLEAARWTILAGHLLKDAPTAAFEMITTTPARLMGMESRAIEVGNWANLLICRAESISDLVRSGPLERTVFYQGRQVAGSLGDRQEPV